MRQTRYILLQPDIFAFVPPKDNTMSEAPFGPITAMQACTYLTSGGTLVYSLHPWPADGLGMLRNYLDMHSNTQGVPLLLAPIGYKATFGGLPGDDFSSEANVLWRHMVLIWLRHRGLEMNHMENKENWCFIKFRRKRSQKRPTFPKIFKPCLWPIALCFVRKHVALKNPQQKTEPRSSSKAGILLTNESYRSPLEVAFKWFQDQPERERVLTAKKRREIEQELAQKRSLPTSPVVNRPFPYGETLSASGMYPTPPDGILSHPATVSTAVEEPTISTMDFTTVPSSDPPAPSDPTPGATAGSNLHDDLFEDMDDDDEYGENDVTDADFSFFDQADMMDIDGTTPAQIQPQEPPSAIEKVVQEEAPGDVKTEEPPDSSKITLEPLKIEHSVEPSPEMPDATSGAEIETKPIMYAPLNPQEVLRRLFSASPASKAAEKSQHDIFGHVDFSKALTMKDDTYRDPDSQDTGESPRLIKRPAIGSIAKLSIRLPRPVKKQKVVSPAYQAITVDSSDSDASEPISASDDVPGPTPVQIKAQDSVLSGNESVPAEDPSVLGVADAVRVRALLHG